MEALRLMHTNEKNIALVCNPTVENRKTLQIADEIANLLSAKEIKHSIFTGYWPQLFDDFTEVWIIGGDGTVNYFINKYPDLQLPLSCFNGGSGNDFHWMLYGDVSIQQQVEKILSAELLAIDAGMCNDKLFLNGVGIGFDGAIVKDMLGKKKLAGKSSYLLAVLKNILRYHEQYLTILLDEEKIEQDCFMISVANGMRYGGGFKVAPKASLTDDFLDVNIVGKIAPLKRMRYLPVIEEGKHLNLSFVAYRHSKKIIIQSPTVLPAHMDGEFFSSDRYEIECLPKRFLFRY